MMRVRKLLAAGAAVCLMGLLGACGQEQNAAQIPEETDALSASAAPSVPDPIQLPLSPLTEEHAAARTAYVSALEQLLESHRLPDGSALGSGDVNQDLSGDAFAVCDVDQDGAEELIVLPYQRYDGGSGGICIRMGPGCRSNPDTAPGVPCPHLL